MKQVSVLLKGICTSVLLLCFNVLVWAQDSPKVEVNGNDVGSWFSRNWIWVVGALALLLIILLLSGSNRNSRTTTVRRNDGYGTTTTTTTTSVDE